MHTLDERKKEILSAIVHDYLESAQPVGSRTIWRNHIHKLSPATIRNTMADLEDEGYIKQPHTSAGRIPTDKGYRFFVDYLMSSRRLSQKEEEIINQTYQALRLEIEELIEKTLEIMTKFSSYVVVLTIPSVYKSVIKMIHNILIDLRKIMVVMITTSGSSHLLIDVTEEETKNLDQNELNKVSNILTHKLNGATFESLNIETIEKISREMPIYHDIINKIFLAIQTQLQAQALESRVYTSGISNIIKQPEFVDLEEIHHILGIVEHQRELAQTLQNYQVQEKEINIHIGSENPMKEMKKMSVVSRSYKISAKSCGTIGIIGPTRMRYGKIKSLVETISEKIDCLFAEE